MEGLRSYWGDNKSELFTLLSLSLPASATYLLNRLVGFTSILFVGRLGPAQLAAAALGGSLTNVVGFGILNGLTGGMPTLCGQVTSCTYLCWEWDNTTKLQCSCAFFACHAVCVSSVITVLAVTLASTKSQQNESHQCCTRSGMHHNLLHLYSC